MKRCFSYRLLALFSAAAFVGGAGCTQTAVTPPAAPAPVSAVAPATPEEPALEWHDVTTWGLEDLVLEAESVGLKGSPTIVSDLELMESKRECQMIEGSLDEKVDLLIGKLVEAGAV